MNKITILMPAKINRYLKIVGSKNGKHLIETNFQSIPIYDILIVNKYDGKNKLNINISPQIAKAFKFIKGDTNQSMNSLSNDKSNLVFKALDILGINFGYYIELIKHIPISAGLAGGSADAAGVLLAIEKLDNMTLDENKYNEIGADVKFTAKGGNWHGSNFGDILQRELIKLPNCSHFVVGIQSFGLSTVKIYQLYDKIGGVKVELGNDLQPAALYMQPILKQVLKTSDNLGAVRSYITGSGPTAIAEVDNYKTAKKIAENWQDEKLVMKSIIVENKLIYPTII
ncbi:MAG: hypothetical protein LBT99_03035 [Bifidobacteriaceae bacterium]|jgi:4-diphosphocytidyl-2-C-methyl-D-erythritol kinase|nr:hypothetical protein [Bifidobacteriaceae bacterium]